MIDRQIKRWRRKLAFRGGFNKSDLDELESHLREEIDRLTESGMSASQACKTAIQQLGDQQMLATEYHKVNFFSMWGKRLVAASAFMLSIILLLGQHGTMVEFTTRESFDHDHPYNLGFIDFRSRPSKKLVYPNINLKNARFFDVYFGEKGMSIMVFVKEDRDYLYIDYNMDGNLTNDGSPYIFLHADNKFEIKPLSRGGTNGFMDFLLLRKPRLKNPEYYSIIFDEEENLKPEYVRIKRVYPDYQGGKNTYYFLERRVINAGKLKLGNKTYGIGLFDGNDNGKFDRRRDTLDTFRNDLLLLDLNEDKNFSFLENDEFFFIDEIFSLGGKNYVVTDIDPQGQYVKVAQTDAPETFDFIRSLERQYGSVPPGREERFDLPPEYWNLKLTTIDGRPLQTSQWRGKTVCLLIYDMPASEHYLKAGPEYAIRQLRSRFPNKKIEILTIIKTEDRAELAQMLTREKIDWPHVCIDHGLEIFTKLFNQRHSYLLILPDGRAIKRTDRITRWFFYKHLKS